MKLNKKNKGKVHPSPSPPPPSSSSLPVSNSTTSNDAVSALKLLPAAIFILIAVLTPEEREVLAYLVTRSIKATQNLSLLLQENSRRSSSKRTPSSAEHKPPVFDCGCFDCYTSYWFRWDSSPNRELIHQAIEAFEEHLATGESMSSKKTGKRREKIGGVRRSSDIENHSQIETPESCTVADGETLAGSPAEEATESPGPAVQQLPESVAEVENEASPEDEEEAARTVAASGGGNHKGLARKVLPDVIGLFNSRLWSLWSPNV